MVSTVLTAGLAGSLAIDAAEDGAGTLRACFSGFGREEVAHPPRNNRTVRDSMMGRSFAVLLVVSIRG